MRSSPRWDSFTASSSSSIRALGALPGDPVQLGVEAEVLAAAEVAVEQRFVAEVADLAAQLPGLVGELAAEHADLAAGRAQQRGEDPQQRRLARAVGAEDDERVAGRGLQGDVLERRPVAVDAAQPDQLDRRLRACLLIGHAVILSVGRPTLVSIGAWGAGAQPRRMVRRPTRSSGRAPSRSAFARTSPRP